MILFFFMKSVLLIILLLLLVVACVPSMTVETCESKKGTVALNSCIKGEPVIGKISDYSLEGNYVCCGKP